jgi:hypothetical protein
MTITVSNFSEDGANVLPTAPAGAALAAGDQVYLDSSGIWQLAVASADGSTNARGTVPRAILQYERFSPVRICHISGVSTGTIGAAAYLSSTGTTGNTITPTAPSDVQVQKIGFYRSTTEVQTEIDRVGLVDDILTVNKTITTAQLLALNAVPIEVIAAPGANKAIIIEDAIASKAAGTAYDGIAAGEDLALRYTDGSGTILVSIEATGFLDQTTAQCRIASKVVPGIALTTNLTPTANAAVVAHMATGEIATGDSDLKLRIRYRVVDTVL